MSSQSVPKYKNQPEKPLCLSQIIAYAMPVMTVSFLLGPLAVLQGIYAKYFGMALTTVASVILVARLFDAISDPLIGYCSDRYYSRTGSRKPFVMAGGLLLILSGYFLFVPPDNVSTLYFLSFFVAYYFSLTLFTVPHLAWGTELTPDSQIKNTIFGVRTLGIFCGQLCFYSMPLLPFFTTDEFTPQTLQWVALSAGLLMLPLLYGCIKIAPDGPKTSSANMKRDSLDVVLTSIITNTPLLLYLGTHVFYGVGMGIWYGLLFIYVDVYLGLSDAFAKVTVIGLFVSSLTIFLWQRLASQVGKKITWGLGISINLISVIGMTLLVPGEASFMQLLVITILNALGFTAFSILMPSILADIVDYGIWKFDVSRAATYFSIYTFTNKTNFALGTALGLAIAGWYGFNPSSSSQTDAAIFGLQLAISWLPAALITISLGFVALAPLNARRHTIIRRRLNSQISEI